MGPPDEREELDRRLSEIYINYNFMLLISFVDFLGNENGDESKLFRVI